MRLKQNSPGVTPEEARQRKMPRQVGAGTAANMRCRIGCTAVSAVRGIRDVHGATAMAQAHRLALCQPVDYGSKYCHDSPTLDEEPLHRARPCRYKQCGQ